MHPHRPRINAPSDYGPAHGNTGSLRGVAETMIVDPVLPLGRFRRLILSPLRRCRSWLRRITGTRIYLGDFVSWAEARAVAGGYDSPLILAKTVAAARAVRDGRAAWERDTVLFSEPEPNAPLLAALLAAAGRHGGALSLVDFGGSLGSTWWQHRPWLRDLRSVSWSIVEQAALVEVGRREFTAGPLRFFSSLAEGQAASNARVLLLSSVLPYLPDPRGLLREIAQGEWTDLIIDRTGFVDLGRDRLTVQQVPPSIYAASYPCWFLDRSAPLQELGPAWRVAAQWLCEDEVDIPAAFRGLRLERR